MKLKRMLKTAGALLSGKLSHDEPNNQSEFPSPPITPGPVKEPSLMRFLRRRRTGKIRVYRKRRTILNNRTGKQVSYRQMRQELIAESQRQGIEVAKARREAQKNGTMLDFKLRYFPMCNHSA